MNPSILVFTAIVWLIAFLASIFYLFSSINDLADKVYNLQQQFNYLQRIIEPDAIDYTKNKLTDNTGCETFKYE